MSGDIDWADFFKLSLAATDGGRRPTSLRERLFPLCRVCGRTCGDLWE